MKEAKDIVGLILSAERIVVTSHRSPDGDSIGSSLGLYRFIKALGKEAVICHPDPCSNFLLWAKGDDEIIDHENTSELVEKHLLNADLIFCQHFAFNAAILLHVSHFHLFITLQQ
ncbi:MAG: DHH family phosphoesterase, partial [Crocinitomicaceae bacterium]|nr:DHH family phosphoesterase [Crocinitomicaceae bacterium]